MPWTELSTRLAPRDIRHALHGGDLVRLTHGVYAPSSAAEEHHRHLALLQGLTSGRDRVVSHATAAQLQGITGDPLLPRYHLTSPRLAARVRRSGMVIGHRSDIPEEDIRQIHGLPTTSVTRTWTDIALSGPLVEALIFTDQVIRAGRTEFGEPSEPWATKHELTEALRRRGSAPGVRTARQALSLSRKGSDSPQETRLRLLMHQAGLPEPDVNAWLIDDAGIAVVQPDLSIPQYRVAIQYDSWEHHRDPGQMLKDIHRAELTEAIGWIEVRITREHLRDGGRRAIEKICRALRFRGWPG